MRQPTKKDLEERNAALSRQNDVFLCLLIDIMRGEAAIQTQGDVTWLISRPGAGSSGCAAIYTQWQGGDSLDVGTIDDLARHAQRARSYAYTAAPEEQDRLMANGALGGHAERISRIGMGEACAPKLPSVLGSFRRVKLEREK